MDFKERNKIKTNKTRYLCSGECEENEPLTMLEFYMDAANKRSSIHRCIHHMEIDSAVRYRMLLNIRKKWIHIYGIYLYISSDRMVSGRELKCNPLKQINVEIREYSQNSAWAVNKF